MLYSLLLCIRYGLDTKGLFQTHINRTRSLIGDTYQSGALFSFSGNPHEITLRVGISFVSESQACSNAETEVGESTFEEIEAQSKVLWNEKLSKVELDLKGTPENVTEMVYSSLYRASLTPVGVFLSFFCFYDNILVSDTSVFVVLAIRIMLREKHKVYSQTRHTHISIRFIAGSSL